MIVLGIIALVFIGPKQLPEVARVVGRLINEWKRATSDLTSSLTDSEAFRDWEERKQKYFSESERSAADPSSEGPPESEQGETPESADQLELKLDEDKS